MNTPKVTWPTFDLQNGFYWKTKSWPSNFVVKREQTPLKRLLRERSIFTVYLRRVVGKIRRKSRNVVWKAFAPSLFFEKKVFASSCRWFRPRYPMNKFWLVHKTPMILENDLICDFLLVVYINWTIYNFFFKSFAWFEPALGTGQN